MKTITAYFLLLIGLIFLSSNLKAECFSVQEYSNPFVHSIVNDLWAFAYDLGYLVELLNIEDSKLIDHSEIKDMIYSINNHVLQSMGVIVFLADEEDKIFAKHLKEQYNFVDSNTVFCESNYCFKATFLNELFQDAAHEGNNQGIEDFVINKAIYFKKCKHIIENYFTEFDSLNPFLKRLGSININVFEDD